MPSTGKENLTPPPVELPLLPRGAPLFIDLPARALVLEDLAPAVGDGLMSIQSTLGAAVVLVRGGRLSETHVFTGDGGHASGPGMLDEVRAWDDADVSSERLEATLVELCAALLQGETVYENLRLGWASWPELLADLAHRADAHVVELSTTSGRGVTCVCGGQQLLSYTDADASGAEPTALEALATTGEGSVRVRRVDAACFAEAVAAGTGIAVPRPDTARRDPRTHPPGGRKRAASIRGGTPTPAELPAPRWPRPADEGRAAAIVPGRPPERSPSAPATTPPPALPEHAPAASRRARSRDPEDAFLRPSIDVLLPDLAWAAPWRTPWPASAVELTEAVAAADDNPDWVLEQQAAGDQPMPRVAEVQDELCEIAQRRLKLSASRVELALDTAAAQDIPLDRVLEDLRNLTIRGVMPRTIAAMVDEMAEAVARRTA